MPAVKSSWNFNFQGVKDVICRYPTLASMGNLSLSRTASACIFRARSMFDELPTSKYTLSEQYRRNKLLDGNTTGFDKLCYYQPQSLYNDVLVKVASACKESGENRFFDVTQLNSFPYYTKLQGTKTIAVSLIAHFVQEHKPQETSPFLNWNSSLDGHIKCSHLEDSNQYLVS